jgi:hypothetical protein
MEGDGMPPPGGIGGGPGDGMLGGGMPGGGMRGPGARPEMPKPLKVNLKVKLANCIPNNNKDN